MKRISSLGYRLASLQMLAEIRDRLLEIFYRDVTDQDLLSFDQECISKTFEEEVK